jgi:hypothetical protein
LDSIDGLQLRLNQLFYYPAADRAIEFGHDLAGQEINTVDITFKFRTV